MYTNKVSKTPRCQGDDEDYLGVAICMHENLRV